MKTFRNNSLRALITGLLIATLVWMPGTADASVKGAKVRAAQMFQTLAGQYSLNVRPAYTYGLLKRGQSIVIRTTLHAGNNYILAAGGCEDAYDVDIAVFDGNGNLVARDTGVQPVAVARVTPIYTGTFFVKITMSNSTANGAHYVLQYAWY